MKKLLLDVIIIGPISQRCLESHGCHHLFLTPSAHCDGPRAPLLSLGALGLGTEADLDRHVRLFGHGHQNLATVPCRCATRVVFLMLQEYLQKAQQPWIY